MGFTNDAQFLNFIPGLSPFTNPVTASIAQGQRAEREQRRAIGRQEEAQRRAEGLARRQLRENAEALRKASQRKPDVTSLLGDAAGAAKLGIGSTMLTGPMGVSPEASRLGRATLLGT